MKTSMRNKSDGRMRERRKRERERENTEMTKQKTKMRKCRRIQEEPKMIGEE